VRILALIGSYRKNGNTAQVVKQIAGSLRGLAAQSGEPMDIETIYLGHMDIQPCRGCRTCFNQGEDKCPLKDDIPAIKAKMKAADCVIIGSPVYVGDVSGITKNWIDRLAHVCHRPEFAGKYAYMVATTGDSPTRHTLWTLNALLSWGYHIIGSAGFKTGALMRGDEVRIHQKRIERVAASIFDIIHSKKASRPPFLSLMTFRIQQTGWAKAARDTIDYRYWESQGWLDPRREFFYPHQTDRLTTALARLTGRILAVFMT